ncbi:MAG: hypothetical protein A2505_04615 [Deltaproteobacteria bacterium RIFOXYD12_FULL_55_16]|nr:MAG: hypothetical protein A2505_04615 [Deltaproteobacteria bacterium RIFOXYD12_FULL_55_16]
MLQPEYLNKFKPKLFFHILRLTEVLRLYIMLQTEPFLFNLIKIIFRTKQAHGSQKNNSL